MQLYSDRLGEVMCITYFTTYPITPPTRSPYKKHNYERKLLTQNWLDHHKISNNDLPYYDILPNATYKYSSLVVIAISSMRINFYAYFRANLTSHVSPSFDSRRYHLYIIQIKQIISWRLYVYVSSWGGVMRLFRFSIMMMWGDPAGGVIR